MGYFLLFVCLGVAAWLLFDMTKRKREMEAGSSEFWYRDRLPFGMRTIRTLQDQERKAREGVRQAQEIDPESDLESVETFHKKQRRKEKGD